MSRGVGYMAAECVHITHTGGAWLASIFIPTASKSKNTFASRAHSPRSRAHVSFRTIGVSELHLDVMNSRDRSITKGVKGIDLQKTKNDYIKHLMSWFARQEDFGYL
jgi:hypothetical protein